MPGNDAAYQHIAVTGGRCQHISTCFYLIGDYGVFRAVKTLNAFDTYNIGSGALYIGTAAV